MIDYRSIPSVPIGDRRYLPKESGIYFVFDDICLIYIGQAVNIHRRWGSRHHRLEQSSFFRNARISWELCKADTLNGLERFYIEELKPLLNSSCIKDFYKIFLRYRILRCAIELKQRDDFCFEERFARYLALIKDVEEVEEVYPIPPPAEISFEVKRERAFQLLEVLEGLEW